MIVCVAVMTDIIARVVMIGFNPNLTTSVPFTAPIPHDMSSVNDRAPHRPLMISLQQRDRHRRDVRIRSPIEMSIEPVDNGASAPRASNAVMA